MARQANPRLQSPQLFSRSARSKSSDDLLKELEDRLKLNRGGFSTFAEDTGAPTGFIVPGGVPVRQGQFVADTAGQTRQTQAAPTYQQAQMQEYNPNISFGYGNDQGIGQIEPFLEAFTKSIVPANDPDGIYQQTGLSYGLQSLPDGGVLYSDGLIRYEDGTVREGDPTAEAIQSMADGSIGYSDGSVRRSATQDELQTQDSVDLNAWNELAQYLGYNLNPMTSEGGQRGLISGIFGQDRTITQPYGVYNPSIEPTGYNIGTDIRTSDLEGQSRYLRLPVSAKVVGVTYDDGTRFGEYSGHQGYGNSILVELSSGERLRFSHLDQMVDVQPGETLSAGDIFGVPGTTGNTYGEHLDLEYYNPQGQLADPATFSGFTNPELYTANVGPMSSEDPNIQRIVERMTGIPQGGQPQQPSMIDQVRQARDQGTSVIDTISQAPQQAAQAVQAAVQPNSPQRQAAGQLTEQAAQTAGIDTELGASEAVTQGRGEEGQRSPAMQARVSALGRQAYNYNPYRQLAGNVLERVGDVIGKPEGSLSEAVAGGPTKRTNQALAAEIGPERPEAVPGIRQNIADIGKDIQSRASNAISPQGSGVNIAEVNKAIETLQPGSGIDRLKSGGEINLFSRRQPDELAPERVVGTSAGANLLAGPTAGASAQLAEGARGQKDTTDPFFKSQLFEKVKGFLTPGQQVQPNQALSTDIFSNDFYSDPSRANQVFGNTFMSQNALSRATDQVKQAYRNAYSGSDYDQSDVERILSQLPNTLTYTPDLPEPKKVQKQMPSLSDYLAMGKTAAQWYAETGQQSTLDALGSDPRNKVDMISGNISRVGEAPSTSQVKYQGQTTGSGSQSVTLPSGRVVTASPGKELRVDSSGNVQEVDSGILSTPTKSPSAQLSFSARQNASKDNLFNKAKEFASGLFKRYFN